MPPTVLKKYVVIKKPSAIQAYIYAKQETEWSDERLWESFLELFAMTLGTEYRKLKGKLFQSMLDYSEKQTEMVQMQIAAAKKDARASRRSGAPVKIPK